MTRNAEDHEVGAQSMRFGSLLVAVVGSAMGLNLSVLAIGPLAPLASDAAAVAPTGETPPADTIPAVLAAVAPEEGDAAPPEITAVAPAAPAPAPAAAPAAGAPPAVAPMPAIPSVVAPVSTTAPATTSQPTTTAPPSTAPSTTQPPTTPSTMVTQQLRYNVDGIGVVVVLYHQGQTLEYSSAELLPGWEVQVETNAPTRIELKFKKVTGGEDEAKWILTRRNGVLSERIER